MTLERRRSRPRQVEIEAPAETWKGQSVPRKEDRRLVQGQGVFVDDIKRHGMGYIHFVRSPYAHAHITSIDVSKAEATPGVYGTLTGEEVASLTDPFFQISSVPGANLKDYALAVGKVRYVGEAIVAVVAETRELARDASELVEIEYEPIDADHRRAPRARRRRADDPRGRRRQPDVGGRLRVGRPRRCVRRGGQDREDRRAALPPLQLDAARVRRRARRVQPRHRAVDDPHEQPVPRLRRDHDGARRCGAGSTSSASSRRTSAAASATRSRRIRSSSSCCLLARKLDRPVQWTEWRTDFHMSMSHGNERWFHDTEVAVKNDGTLLGFRTKALDDAGAWLRYEPLGGVIWAQVTPGHVPLAQHPARVHAGRDEQGAGVAEPRLLAHAAPLVHRADDRHRRARARPRSGRGAQAQLHPRRGHAVRDAERLRLRLGRLRADARHRARPDRLGRASRRSAPTRRRAASCSASASARRSTRARTTSASRG